MPGVVMDSNGDLFGTTNEGGTDNEGTVFELTPGSGGYTLNTLVNFDGTDGVYPQAGVVMDSNGDLFGTTSYGGANTDGTVFELTPGSGGYTLNTLVNFDYGTDGAYPQAGVVMDSNVDLFGTTSAGGANTDGTVFELTPGIGGYTLNTLVNFDGTDGVYPYAGVVMDSNGDLFGTTFEGGANSDGTVYEFIQTPAVSAVEVASGSTAGGTAVTITGTSLGNASAVDFGSTAGTIVSDSATQIVATSPAGQAGTANITVTTPGGTSVEYSGDHYTYVAPPAVTGVSPNDGAVGGGTTVTITGTGLANASAVDFGATAGAIVSDSAAKIVATSPAESAGTVNVTVTTPIGTSATLAADEFSYVTAPVSLAKSIVEISSSSVAAGSTDAITFQAVDGYGNDLTAGGLSVAFSLGSGAGQGTFGQVTDNGNGTYTATFAGTIAGSNTVTATVGGQSVTSTAPAVTVTPGPASPAKSIVEVFSSSVVAGSTDTITLQAEDAYGNDLTTGGLDGTFGWSARVAARAPSALSTDNDNGTYTTTFTGTLAGSNTIAATIGGQTVTSTSPSIAVTPGHEPRTRW